MESPVKVHESWRFQHPGERKNRDDSQTCSSDDESQAFKKKSKGSEETSYGNEDKLATVMSEEVPKVAENGTHGNVNGNSGIEISASKSESNGIYKVELEGNERKVFPSTSTPLAETSRAVEKTQDSEACDHFQKHVINLKETQLIGNITADLEVGEEDDSIPVHIMSPTEQSEKDKSEGKDFGTNALTVSEDQKLLLHTDDMVEQPANEKLEGHQALGFNEDNRNISLATISTYEDFLEHLDQKLKKIEQELLTLLNVSTLLLDDEKPKNAKVQQTTIDKIVPISLSYA